MFVSVFSVPISLSSNISGYFQTKSALIADNASLHKMVTDLSLENEQIKALRQENKRLRHLLRFEKKIGFDTISAEVIARNPNDWLGSFLINKGEKDGLEKDSAVCSAEGLLGKTAEVYPTTSTVMLITHPSFKAGGMLKDSRINGIVIGTGEETVRMIYLPVDAKIKKDMEVVTSSFSQIFPKGISIGKVIGTGKSKTGLYQYAIIKPYANMSTQEEVLCIK